jgi:glycosyltransferase involved in cell wall biosynthesis
VIQAGIVAGDRATGPASASGTLEPPVARPSRTGVAAPSERLRVAGKFFACGDERFLMRGVTYGTFRSRADGALFPDEAAIARDFSAIAAAGFNVVRTYTTPPEDLLAQAAANDLLVLASSFFEDWRYMLGSSRSERRRIRRQARDAVRSAVQALAGNPAVAALVIANEVPADVVRWVGAGEVSKLLGELAEVARAWDPDLLVTYASYPTTEYLSVPGLDFLTYNVFLERESDFRAYLTRLQNLAGDRPLVLGEIGLDAGQGEDFQARTLDWQLATSLERGVAGTCVFSWTDQWWVADQPVEGWRFGLTDAERRPRPALAVASRWNRRTVADLRDEWPSISVVICAHNASSTIGECLTHVCGLHYPELEVIVVDDGSTDETAAIAAAHPGVQVVTTPPVGLAQARNLGIQAAHGEIVAYLDSDAFPPAEWPYFLALGFDRSVIGGVGGPNLPPSDDPPVAQAVARAPGGPVHVLLSDDRAEHIPGCNMAFWRDLIVELDGFDPVFTAAGDDVDFCWRVLDAGWSIGFHPAAFVWHRRRTTVGAYLRQQRGYGRAEALVQSRHPERFTPIGTARWRGSIYGSLAQRLLRPRIYRGEYGTAAYQSVYRGTGHSVDIAHQAGIPAAVVAMLTAPAGIVAWPLALPAIAGLLLALTLLGLDLAALGAGGAGRRGGVRLLAALLHLAQPLPRLWGLLAHSARFRRRRYRNGVVLPGPVKELGRGVLLLPLTEQRGALVPKLAACLSGAGINVSLAGPWDAHDATLAGSLLIRGRLVTSAHPAGSLQLRIDPALRIPRFLWLCAVVAILAVSAPVAAAVLAAAMAGELARGLWRLGPLACRAVRHAARPDA